jgi:hypothetical protein
MLNWLKIQSIRAKGAAHSLIDVVKNGGVAPLAISGILALYAGMGFAALFFQDDNRDDFSSEVGDAVAIHENGIGVDLPGDCDVDGQYYILSNKKGGTELVNDDSGSGFARVPDVETQKYTAELISNCFDEMALRLDNEADIDAVEDLAYGFNVTYSDMAVLRDSEDNAQDLGIDVIDVDLLSLEDRVENHSDYDGEAVDENIALYRDEFKTVQQRWNNAAKKIESKSDTDPYRDTNGAILNADKYARYDYDSLTLMEAVKPIGVAFPICILFLCATGAFNSRSFQESSEKRKEQIAYLKRTKGSSPIL